METFKSGEAVGNGAAINVELGWIPDRVEVYNATDGDIVTVGFPNRMVIPFSSGGVTEIQAGDKIEGETSNASAYIKEVLLYSGSWAGGDAAGFFIVERDDIVGTFQAENVKVGANANLATVTANVTHGYNIDTEVAAANPGATGLSAYVGASAANAKGFTIGATVAEEAKLLRWSAWRNVG